MVYLEAAMGSLRLFIVLFFTFAMFLGCGSRLQDVMYEEAEKTNRIEVTTVSGRKVEGTIVKMEPHQLTLFLKNKKVGTIAKSSIRMIKRYPPVNDDYGRGIPEEDIESVKTNRNAVIYGIGGGALSFGAGFFIGSMAGKESSDGSTVLIASTLGVGGLGTYLFVRAGKVKDRKDAIEVIRDQRRSEEFKDKESGDTSLQELKNRLEEEKKKQEGLREQREQLLKELGEKKKKEEE